jgi:hypothetical protein
LLLLLLLIAEYKEEEGVGHGFGFGVLLRGVRATDKEDREWEGMVAGAERLRAAKDKEQLKEDEKEKKRMKKQDRQHDRDTNKLNKEAESLFF